MPLVAGFDDGQAHFVKARRFFGQRLEDAHLGLADPWPHHALVVGHDGFQAGLERADRLPGLEDVAVEGHDDAFRQKQRPEVVVHLGELLPCHLDPALEDASSFPLLPGLLDAAFLGIEDDGALRRADAGLFTDRQDHLLAQVELTTLLRVVPLVALGEERVGVGQVTEPFGAVVLDRQIGERATRHQRQGDVDLRDAIFVQGVLDQFTDQPTLAVFLGLPAQPGLVHCEPLLRHGNLLKLRA